MKDGPLEVLQIGYDFLGNQILEAAGTTSLSLSYVRSDRLIAGCIGLNICIAILSIIALFRVACRRFEFFSFFSLLLFAIASTTLSAAQLVQIIKQHSYDERVYDQLNYIGGPLVLSVLL